MSAPLVTCLCLTTHPKRAAYLPDALRSYRQQSYGARELVVINDGAPLTSARPDVRVVNLPARAARWTIGEKRNAGVRAARGVYLATWDDDDVSLPSRLSEEVEAAERTGAAVVLAGGMFVGDASLSLAGRCSRALAPVQASALLRRDAVVAAGGYPVADYLEDAALLEHVRFLGRGRVEVLPDARWYVVRRHGSNITLRAGERDAVYTACALVDVGDVREASRAIAALRRGAGGDDVREVV